jgi:hypothetical protein
MKESILFITQLEALAVTMEESIPNNFDMGTYYRKFGDCGYVACICGEQVISGRLESFPLSSIKAEYVGKEHIPYISGFIDDDLRNACIKATGSNYLANSVTMAGINARSYEAALSTVFTPEQLQHQHLNTKSSPKIAASYIRMLIAILTKEDS